MLQAHETAVSDELVDLTVNPDPAVSVFCPEPESAAYPRTVSFARGMETPYCPRLALYRPAMNAAARAWEAASEPEGI